VTLTNTGTVPLLSPTFTFTGNAAADFAVASNTCGTSVAVGANCTVNVTFKPTLAGNRTATLTLGYTGAGTPALTVGLTGTGTVSEVLSPNPLTFTNVRAGSGAAGAVTKAVTLTNNDAAPVTITNAPSIAAQNGGNGNFAYTAAGSTCTSGTVIQAGGTCTINVTYTPGSSGTGTRTATLSVSVDGAAQTTALSATTVAPTNAVAPTTVAFGTVARGSSSTATTVTVTNIGTVPMTLTNPFNLGGGTTNFSAGGGTGTACAAGLTLMAGETCSISVKFNPAQATSTGNKSATLTITSTASTKTVALSGTAK
jgi:hypothetical protein